MGRKLTAEIGKTFTSIKKATSRAEVKALNDTAKSALANISKFVRAKYNIKLSDFKDKRFVWIKYASVTNPQVTLMLTHVPIGLAKFGSKTKKGKGGGVIVTAKKGGQKLYKNSFLLKLSDSKRKVMLHRTGEAKRTMTKGRYKGKEREPLKAMYGPSAMQLVSSQVAQDELTEIFHTRFAAIFPNKLSFELSKI